MSGGNYETNTFETNKRGSEELGNGSESAGSGASNKRPRPNHVNTTPSKVIHIRNVPLECTEGELYTLCAPFGRVATALIMKGKGQALVQMQEQAGATALVDFYANNPAMLRTNLIHLQYSNREEITNKPPIQIPGVTGNLPPGTQPPVAQTHQSGALPQSDSPNEACVLLVNVANITYPVNIELLHSVFSKYGPVTKVVTFSKNGGFQSFVQFAYPSAAETAKNALDGQNIYVGCCSLRINFSTIKDLDVKYNNEKSRDFMNPYLPTGPSSASAGPEMPSPYPSPHAPQPYADPNSHMGYHPQPYPQGPPHPYGTGLAGPKPALGAGGPGASPVVIVSGMNEEKVTPDALFTLFGVYGDVLKVKILFNKKDTALVQMATPQHAEAVITHLNSITLYGKPIRINYSKHNTIMLPSNNPNDENIQFTKEYVGSPLHRFKSAGKTFKHICAPSATLHVSSIPASVTETSLRELFAQQGEVVNVKFFPNNEKRMALVQMGSIPDATSALITFHNYRFEEAQVPIRISFAKSAIYA